MIIGDNWRISRVLFWLRGTRIMAPVRSPAYHQRSYVEKRGATVENLLDVHCGDTARRFPASSPRAAKARGYGGVEDPPIPLDVALACAALTVVTFLAVSRRESRLARLIRFPESLCLASRGGWPTPPGV